VRLVALHERGKRQPDDQNHKEDQFRTPIARRLRQHSIHATFLSTQGSEVNPSDHKISAIISGNLMTDRAFSGRLQVAGDRLATAMRGGSEGGQKAKVMPPLTFRHFMTRK
jgi:hypothetical protein